VFRGVLNQRDLRVAEEIMGFFLPLRNQRKCPLDEVFVKINGETHYLWRAVDHESEVLDAFLSKNHSGLIN
jgi:hypothetical protein